MPCYSCTLPPIFHRLTPLVVPNFVLYSAYTTLDRAPHAHLWLEANDQPVVKDFEKRLSGCFIRLASVVRLRSMYGYGDLLILEYLAVSICVYARL